MAVAHCSTEKEKEKNQRISEQSNGTGNRLFVSGWKYYSLFIYSHVEDLDKKKKREKKKRIDA